MLQMTLAYVFSPSESLDSDSEVVPSSHELLNLSSSRTSLTALTYVAENSFG